MERIAIFSRPSGSSRSRERPEMANTAPSAIKMYDVQATGLKYVAAGSMP